MDFQELVPDTDILTGLLADLERQSVSAHRSIKYWQEEIDRLRAILSDRATEHADRIQNGPRLNRLFTTYVRVTQQRDLVENLLEAASH